MVKGVKCMVIEEDWNLSGKHTMEYTEDALHICTLETNNVIKQCYLIKFT